MGRHRDSGSGLRPPLPPDGTTVTSHRPPPGVARARAISLVAAGALAGGAAIVGTTGPWSQEASSVRPAPPSDGGALGAPDDRSGAPVLPAPAPAPRAPEPAQPVAAPLDEPIPEPIAQPPARTVWRGDGPAAFLSTPWNTVGALPPQLDDDEVSFVLTGRGQRSEVEPALPVIREGDEHEVTFSVRLDRDFPTSAPGHQVITRWENDSPGPAPLDLRVHDGQLVLHGGGGHPSGPRTFTRLLGPAPTEEWARLHVRVHFSADPDKAGVSVWRDGEPVVDDDRPPGGTLYPGQQSYLKAGLHRDRAIATPTAVQFREWRVDHVHAPDSDDSATAHDAPSETSSTDDGQHEDAEDREAPARESSESGERDEPSDRGESSDRDASQDEASQDQASEDDSAENDSAENDSAENDPVEDDSGSEDDASPRRDAHESDSEARSESDSDSGSESESGSESDSESDSDSDSDSDSGDSSDHVASSIGSMGTADGDA